MIKKFLMRFSVFRNYSDCMHKSLYDIGDGLHTSRRGILISHHATTVIGNLTGGIFSTTLLLLLLGNATAAEYVKFIALNTAVLSFAGMTQLLSPVLFEKMKRRRRAIYVLTAISHFINIFVLPALVIIDLPTATKAYLYISAAGIMQACGAISGPPYSVWMMHNLPQTCRSDYLVFQNMTTDVLTQGLLLILSLFMDFFKAHNAVLAGILIMRALAIGAVAVQYLARNLMAEPEYNTEVQHVTFREMLRTPLSSKPFLVTVLIATLWSFGTTIGGIYYSAYLLDGAGLSYTFISICGMLGIPLNIYMLPRWNKFIVKFGWLPALSLSMIMYGICFALNVMVTEHTAWMYLISTVFCMSTAGGVTLGFVNLPFLYMPKSMESSCLAFYNLCSSLAAMAAASAAESFCILTENRTLNLFGLVIENRAYICFIAFIILLLNAGIVWLLYRSDRKNHAEKNQSTIPSEALSQGNSGA